MYNKRTRRFKKGGRLVDDKKAMVLSQIKEVHHHADELAKVLANMDTVDAWVVGKMERATTDLSDITHYLDGTTEYADGGMMSDNTFDNILMDYGFKKTKTFSGKRFFSNGKNDGGLMARGGKTYNQLLEDFNVDDLDDFESMRFKQMTNNGVPKATAIELLINEVEGDYSQLSPKLARLAKKQNKMMANGGIADGNKFKYMMLGRLKQDNDYYLGYGNRSPKNLWAGNVKDQISEMKKLWNELPNDQKPEWLSMEDILRYEKEMSNEMGSNQQTEIVVVTRMESEEGKVGRRIPFRYMVGESDIEKAKKIATDYFKKNDDVDLIIEEILTDEEYRDKYLNPNKKMAIKDLKKH